MKVIHANSSTVLALGRCGENLARQVVFDIKDFEYLYGVGTVEILYQRPNDAQPYPLAVQRDGTIITWNVTATDTAIPNAFGKCELRYYSGETLVKSKIWQTWVDTALSTPSETVPPEPEQGWVDKVLAAGQAAVNASVNSPKIGANGNWFVWDFEAGAYVDTGVAASGGGSGAVSSVNGKIGAVELTAEDVGAVPVPETASVGQTIVVKAVDEAGKPTEWEAADMPSGGGSSLPATGVEDTGKVLTVTDAGVPGWMAYGHWETVLDTVWDQDVIYPTALDPETGIFTCAEGELDHLELGKEYVFFQQCTVEGVAYNAIINDYYVKVTKLSDTTFSINATPPTTFAPTNVKFSKGECLVITDIDSKKIRLTLDGQFVPTAAKASSPFYGAGKPYFAENTGYVHVRSAYHAYQQLTAEVESPFRIVGKILCGFNAPSSDARFHFKNNSFCCPLIPRDVPEGYERTYCLTSEGTKIAKLYSTNVPWLLGGSGGSSPSALINDYLRIISGTRVKLERWVE